MSTEAWIFPVGHYGGPFFPDVEQPLRYHHVRVGVSSQKLWDEAEFRVWALAHGLPDRPGTEPWTRRDVEAEAANGGVADSTTTVEGLLTRGLLVEVAPGTEQATEFARTHRIEPLLVGLGNSPDDLLGYRVGMAGYAPLVVLSRTGSELWQFGQSCENLWEACELFARVAKEIGETDPAHTDPVELLDRSIPALRTLVSHSAGYLDAVT